MKNSQKNAISYADSAKKKAAAHAGLVEIGADLVFPWQPVYKTERGFLDAATRYDRRRFLGAVAFALSSLQDRALALHRVGCTSFKVDECNKAIHQCYFLLCHVDPFRKEVEDEEETFSPEVGEDLS